MVTINPISPPYKDKYRLFPFHSCRSGADEQGRGGILYLQDGQSPYNPPLSKGDRDKEKGTSVQFINNGIIIDKLPEG